MSRTFDSMLMFIFCMNLICQSFWVALRRIDWMEESLEENLSSLEFGRQKESSSRPSVHSLGSVPPPPRNKNSSLL